MRRALFAVAAGALVMTGTGVAQAADAAKDFGKAQYESNCAVCHGPAGKGDGPFKPFLTVSPTDLTTLAARNGGVFPMDRVYQVIDGREVVRGHGTRDMPIWGREYSMRAAEYYMEIPYDPDRYVRSRILALAEYLYRLQKR